MPKPTSTHALSRRERQIMDILYRRGRATAAEVNEDLPGEPHYSTVRTQLRVLEEKGHVKHAEEGLRYVYMPAVPRRQPAHCAFGRSPFARPCAHDRGCATLAQRADDGTGSARREAGPAASHTDGIIWRCACPR
jgi:hypothetical protein